MTLALKRAFEEKIKEHKKELTDLSARRLDADPDRRTDYDAAINQELEVLWDLLQAKSEQ